MSGAMRRAAGPLGTFFRNRVEDATAPRLDQLSRQIEEVRVATVDIRRIVTDDLDASNEATALLGRALAALQATVDELRAEVAELRAKL